MSSGKAEKAVKGIRNLLLGRIVSKALTFGFLIIFVRLLSKDELAILPLYYAAIGAATLLFSFGIPVTLVREIPRLRTENPEKMHSLLFTGFIFVLAGVCITSIIALHFSKPIQSLFLPDLKQQSVYYLITIGMIIGGWKNLMSFILRALQKYRDLAIYEVINELLQRTLGLIGYLIAGIDGLLIGFLTGGMICNSWYTKKVAEFIFSVKKFQPILNLIKFSWPYYLESYLFYFRSNGDILIISSNLGSSSLAVYYVAKRLYDLLSMIIKSIQDVIAPSLAQLMGESRELAIKGYSRMAILIPIILIPMGTLAAGLSYSLIDIIGGSNYIDQATLPAALFCGVAILQGLLGLQTRGIFIFGNPSDRLKIVICQFIVYFPLLYLLVIQFGIVGAPVAQAISLILASIFAEWIISKTISYRKAGWINIKILIVALAGLLILIMMQLLYYSLLLVPIYFIVTLAVMLLIISLLSTKHDLQLVKEALPSSLKEHFSNYMRIRSRFFS